MKDSGYQTISIVSIVPPESDRMPSEDRLIKRKRNLLVPDTELRKAGVYVILGSQPQRRTPGLALSVF
jgi:hypothetical protein